MRFLNEGNWPEVTYSGVDKTQQKRCALPLLPE